MKVQFNPIRNILIFVFAFIILLATTVLGSPFDPASAQITNWALQFDGTSDMVQLDSEANIIGTGWESTKSVMLWVKPDAGNTCTDPDVASCPSIISAKPHWWGISVGLTDPMPPDVPLDRIWVWNFDTTEDPIGIPYTPGEWVHIALVHQGGFLSAYKNGVLAGRISSGATHQTDPGKLYLGGLFDINFFAGQIDEVSIWNIGLSASDIIAGMYGLNGDEAGLKAYYMMSDGSGRTLTDDSADPPNWPGTLIDKDFPQPPPPQPPEAGPLWVEHDDFVPPPIPVAPSNLTVSPVGFSGLNLFWDDNSSNEFSFEIERCVGASCSSFSPLDVVLDNVTTYLDTSVVPGTTYCYRVRAANTGGASDYTNTACTTVLIPVFIPMAVR